MKELTMAKLFFWGSILFGLFASFLLFVWIGNWAWLIWGILVLIFVLGSVLSFKIWHKIWYKTAEMAGFKYFHINPNSWYGRFIIASLFLPTLWLYIFAKFLGKDAEEDFWKIGKDDSLLNMRPSYKNMRPSYGELIELNPLLINKTPEEVEALLDAIEECGFIWDDDRKSYYNPEIDRSIRTQGLDMFTPNVIKEMYAEILAEIRRDPEGYAKRAAAMKLLQKWIVKLLGLFVLTLLFGWIFLPMKYWLGSLAIIVFLCFILYTNAVRKIRSYKGI